MFHTYVERIKEWHWGVMQYHDLPITVLGEEIATLGLRETAH
jgi:hypothetical protein